MGKSLVIAEKPSVAGDLARALGKFEKAAHGRENYFENDTMVICSSVGHLLELVAPEGSEPARGKWKLESLPVTPEHFDLQPIENTLSRLKLLRHLLKRKDITEVINACDAGREGELIFRNIIRDSRSERPMQRLWLQSMTPAAIREAFARLRPDAELRPLADAALSRSESDWLVGINATRALTAFNTRLVGGFQKTTAGRVQTPTLAILVEREQRIRAFKPRTYWEVFADFSVAAGGYRGRWFDPEFQKDAKDEDRKPERLWDAERANAIRDLCEGKPGQITEEKKAQTQAPPLLYDLTTLQREANQRFGLPANRTLQIAQALYERFKVLTYPRTDSRYLPEDYIGTSKAVLGKFTDPTLAAHARKAVESGWVRPNKRIFNNARVSDHFAIVPTGEDPSSLDDFQRKIFDLVARRFVAVFYPSAQFEITTRITLVETERFKTEGKIITDPGWLAVYGREVETDDGNGKAVVPVSPNEIARTEKVEVAENQTRPPARLNDATLLSAMEGAGKLIEDEDLREAMREKGLGTPATRASIIEGLLYEGYIERRGKELVATQKGISLITLLRNLHADVLTKPELTGEWEFRLKEIEHGHLSRPKFMEGIRSLTEEIVQKVKNFGSGPIGGEYATLEIACPKCGQGPYKEDYRTWSCQACGLRLWKSLAGREFSPEEIRALLVDRRVGPLEGFVSKQGRRFAAAITLDGEGKATFEFDRPNETGEAAAPPDWTGKEPVGTCPLCKEGRVFATEAAYLCEHQHAKKCTFRMGSKILQRDIPAAQVRKLCETGKTDLIERFISKKGKPFKAFLVLDKGKVGFEFEPRKARPTKPAKAGEAEPSAGTGAPATKKASRKKSPSSSDSATPAE